MRVSHKISIKRPKDILVPIDWIPHNRLADLFHKGDDK